LTRSCTAPIRWDDDSEPKDLAAGLFDVLGEPMKAGVEMGVCRLTFSMSLRRHSAANNLLDRSASLRFSSAIAD
jgi:hypothetical protein